MASSSSSPSFPPSSEEFIRSCTLASSPDVRGLPHQLGIDEAGRGPVLGPMVYAYAACPIASSDALAQLGFADSKTLNATQRTTLLTSLLASPLLSAHFISLSPHTISASMQSIPRTSLNVLSHDTAIALIHHALHTLHLHVTHVYVDTVGDPQYYHTKLSSAFPHLTFTVTPKADSLFPIVSAASIVAKTTRDRQLDDWHFTEDDGTATSLPPPAVEEAVEDLTSEPDSGGERGEEGEEEVEVRVVSSRKGGRRGGGKRKKQGGGGNAGGGGGRGGGKGRVQSGDGVGVPG